MKINFQIQNEYFSVYLYCEKFLLCQRWDLNQGPLAPKSNTLTTRLCKRKEVAILGWLLVPLPWLYPEKWPQRLPVASEVTSDLKFELSGLNNPCSSAFLAPKCFFEPFVRKKGRTKWTCRSCARSSPQIKIHILRGVSFY